MDWMRHPILLGKTDLKRQKYLTAQYRLQGSWAAVLEQESSKLLEESLGSNLSTYADALIYRC